MPFLRLGVLPHTLNRRDDVGIRAAATNVAAHEFFHVRVVRSAWFFQQRHRGHDLSGCAIAALIGVAGDKCRLHRVQIFRLTDALDSRDLFTLMHGGEGKDTNSLAGH